MPFFLLQLSQPIHVGHQNVAESLCSAFKVHFTALRVLFIDMWIESGLAVYVWLVIGVNPTQTESFYEKKIARLAPLLIGLALLNTLFLISNKTART